MSHRTFDTGIDPEQPFVDFDIAGPYTSKDDRRGQKWSETFTVVPVAPAGVLQDLANSVRVNSRGDRVYSTINMLSFMEQVLIEEDKDRFDRLMRDSSRVVPAETLGKIVVWLADEVVNRPTGPSLLSGIGPASDGNGSTVSSPSAESPSTG